MTAEAALTTGEDGPGTQAPRSPDLCLAERLLQRQLG